MRYKLLLLNAGSDIETAAFVVEQRQRILDELGPLDTYLGYSPTRMRLSPPRGQEAAYRASYYWNRFVAIPQFVGRAAPRPGFYMGIALKAAATALRGLSSALGKMIATGSRAAFFERIKQQRVGGIPIGLPILSDYLRSSASHGYLRIDLPFAARMFQCHWYAHYWLSVLRGFDFSQVLFMNPETTYRDEIVRRALLARGASEVVCDRWDYGSLRASRAHRDGLETMLCPPPRVRPSDAERDAARRRMNERLQGRLRYPYLGRDVDPAIPARLAPGVPPGAQRPRAVVFLHAVADAQHFYGPDCFVDLDDWLWKSLALLEARRFSIYVKMHPRFFDLKSRWPGDARYKAYLERRLGVSWDRLASGEIRETARSEVYAVDYRLGVSALRAAIGDFLVVTHHGTIAAEGTALGLPAVCSARNAFQRFPPFAWSYETLEEYECLIAGYARGDLRIDEPRLDNLFMYLHEAQRDLWLWIWSEYRRLSGCDFVSEPGRFAEFLLAVSPAIDASLYAKMREVFACRMPPGDARREPGPKVSRA